MRRLVAGLFTALCLFAAGPAEAADPLVLQLKWFAQAQFAGYFVAEAKGFYRNVGLDVTIKPGGPDTDPAKILAEGGADVAVDWMPSALAARERGAPLVNIAQIFQRSGMMLTCRKDSGIRRPADLKGKTVAVWFEGNQYPFLAWMAKLGFRTAGDKPDITILEQQGDVQPLLQKQAACISTMNYNEYWQVIDAGVKPAELVVFPYEDQQVATLEDGLYTTESKLADPGMRDRLRRFVRASLDGWQYALAHPQETVTIVLRSGRGDALDQPRERRMLGEIAKLMPGTSHGIGYLEPAAYERTVDVLLAGGAGAVIHRRPEGAWTHAVWDAAQRRP